MLIESESRPKDLRDPGWDIVGRSGREVVGVCCGRIKIFMATLFYILPYGRQVQVDMKIGSGLLMNHGALVA